MLLKSVIERNLLKTQFGYKDFAKLEQEPLNAFILSVMCAMDVYAFEYHAICNMLFAIARRHKMHID